MFLDVDIAVDLLVAGRRGIWIEMYVCLNFRP